MIEKYRNEIDETSSAILSLNTIANTLGATLAGGLAEKAFGDGSNSILWFAGGMTLGILFFSEILPKNLTVIYRSDMLGLLVPPLIVVRFLMSPFSKFANSPCEQWSRLKKNQMRRMRKKSFYLPAKEQRGNFVCRRK